MPSGGASELYRVGDLLVDVTGASVSRHGERIVLPPRTFELLVALVRHYPSTVRRPDLLDTVWPDETVSDQTLSHRVMVLRKALGDHAEEPAYVAGERGFGYRLLAPVERIGPGEPDPRARTGACVARSPRAPSQDRHGGGDRHGAPRCRGAHRTPRRSRSSRRRRRRRPSRGASRPSLPPRRVLLPDLHRGGPASLGRSVGSGGDAGSRTRACPRRPVAHRRRPRAPRRRLP